VRRIAVACLKYGMLSVGNTKCVIFNLEDWVNPEGDTGAYLMYSLARIAGVFRKADVEVDLADGLPSGVGFGEEAERALLGHLLQYPTAVQRAADACDPSIIAGFAHECSRLFNRFFSVCPILKSEGDVKRARLVLIRSTEQVLTQALGLLGIEPVTAM
jgi:arginyl-tRNA synthetase